MRFRTYRLAAAGGLIALALTACAPKYHVISTESESPVLPKDCVIRVLEGAPSDPFTVLGTVEPDNPEKLTDKGEELVASIKEQACTRTANAVIVAKDPAGKITKATLIRIR